MSLEQMDMQRQKDIMKFFSNTLSKVMQSLVDYNKETGIRKLAKSIQNNISNDFNYDMIKHPEQFTTVSFYGDESEKFWQYQLDKNNIEYISTTMTDEENIGHEAHTFIIRDEDYKNIFQNDIDLELLLEEYDQLKDNYHDEDYRDDDYREDDYHEELHHDEDYHDEDDYHDEHYHEELHHDEDYHDEDDYHDEHYRDDDYRENYHDEDYRDDNYRDDDYREDDYHDEHYRDEDYHDESYREDDYHDERYRDDDYRDDDYRENYHDEDYRDDNYREDDYHDEDHHNDDYRDDDYREDDYHDEYYRDEDYHDDDYYDEHYRDDDYRDENYHDDDYHDDYYDERTYDDYQENEYQDSDYQNNEPQNNDYYEENQYDEPQNNDYYEENQYEENQYNEPQNDYQEEYQNEQNNDYQEEYQNETPQSDYYEENQYNEPQNNDYYDENQYDEPQNDYYEGNQYSETLQNDYHEENQYNKPQNNDYNEQNEYSNTVDTEKTDTSNTYDDIHNADEYEYQNNPEKYNQGNTNQEFENTQWQTKEENNTSTLIIEQDFGSTNTDLGNSNSNYQEQTQETSSYLSQPNNNNVQNETNSNLNLASNTFNNDIYKHEHVDLSPESQKIRNNDNIEQSMIRLTGTEASNKQENNSYKGLKDYDKSSLNSDISVISSGFSSLVTVQAQANSALNKLSKEDQQFINMTLTFSGHGDAVFKIGEDLTRQQSKDVLNALSEYHTVTGNIRTTGLGDIQHNIIVNQKAKAMTPITAGSMLRNKYKKSETIGKINDDKLIKLFNNALQTKEGREVLEKNGYVKHIKGVNGKDEIKLDKQKILKTHHGSIDKTKTIASDIKDKTDKFSIGKVRIMQKHVRLAVEDDIFFQGYQKQKMIIRSGKSTISAIKHAKALLFNNRMRKIDLLGQKIKGIPLTSKSNNIYKEKLEKKLDKYKKKTKKYEKKQEKIKVKQKRKKDKRSKIKNRYQSFKDKHTPKYHKAAKKRLAAFKTRFLNSKVDKGFTSLLNAFGSLKRLKMKIVMFIIKVVVILIGQALFLTVLIAPLVLIVTTITTCFTYEGVNPTKSDMALVYEELESQEIKWWSNIFKDVMDEDNPMRVSNLKYSVPNDPDRQNISISEYCDYKNSVSGHHNWIYSPEKQGIKGPCPFKDAPEEAYKWMKIIDGTVSATYENQDGESIPYSNITDITCMTTVVNQLEENVSTTGDRLTEEELKDPSFFESVGNFFQNVWTGIKGLAHMSQKVLFPGLDDWFAANADRSRAKTLMIYAKPLFNLSHQANFGLDVEMYPTERTREKGDNVGPDDHSNLCSSNESQSVPAKRENDGYGCMSYSGFFYNYDSDEDLYYVHDYSEIVNADPLPHVHPAAKTESNKEGDHACCVPSGKNEDWKIAIDYNPDCWIKIDSGSYEDDSSPSTRYDDNWTPPNYSGDDPDYGYDIDISADVLTVTYTACYDYDSGGSDEDDDDPESYYYYETYEHHCSGHHTGYYCGGHLNLVVIANVKGFSKDQKAFKKETYSNNLATGSDATLATDSDTQALGNNAKVSVKNGEGTWANYYKEFLMTDDKSLVMVHEGLLQKAKDIFDIDLAQVHYNKSINNEEPYPFPGWDPMHMEAALSLHSTVDEWNEMYDFTVRRGCDLINEALYGAGGGGGMPIFMDEKDKQKLMASVFKQLGDNDPTALARAEKIYEAADLIGKVAYSQRYHNLRMDDGYNDCSGYTSYIWKDVVKNGKGAFSTHSYKDTFQGTKYWGSEKNGGALAAAKRGDIKPGDILLHYEKGGNHALLFTGFDENGNMMSLDCSTCGSVTGPMYRSRGDNYYSQCCYIKMDDMMMDKFGSEYETEEYRKKAKQRNRELLKEYYPEEYEKLVKKDEAIAGKKREEEIVEDYHKNSGEWWKIATGYNKKQE